MRRTILAVALILAAATAGASDFPFQDSPPFRVEMESGADASGLSFFGLSLCGNIPLGPFGLKPVLGARYSQIGNLVFVRSDEYAYRDPVAVSGYDCEADGGFLLTGGPAAGGVRIKTGWMGIADINIVAIRETALAAGVRLGPALFTLETVFRQETVCALAGFRTPLFLLPLPVSLSVSVQWAENLVLAGELEVGSADGDLRAVLGCPYGLFQATDTIMEIAIWKRFGDWEWGVKAVPSLSGNDRYETAVSWAPTFN